MASTTHELPERADFARLTAPYRRELVALCYRMLGSAEDAEDVVQETYLNAWRAFDSFQGRASLRTWLYRIATRACLKALEGGVRRPLPSGLAGPGEIPDGPMPRQPEIAWLRPIPDDPAETVESRQSMRLAFVAALQHLPPRQRAVLILRDVLSWRTAEVAELIGTTDAAVTSALQRARAQLRRVSPREDTLMEPSEAQQRELLDGYAMAFQNADVDTLTRLLAEDAVWEMPPIPVWFAGADRIARFLAGRVLVSGPGHFRLLPTTANGQPAFGLYTRDAGGVHRPHGLQVLSLAPTGITRVVTFHDAGLPAAFALPAVVSAAG
ncbi:sigma-70 family RNA polymerase sigma factor [Pseudonocardia acaciae]|uniref:sigma-70 family RNA polymerase sigma factor n=1 Tax=Pseudonocardia acaciae TaxID=551276 RepID=UPI00048D2514|nr:sigma-70 family RNA polymerase sigma factor [Pseudonocardia acaciae]